MADRQTKIVNFYESTLAALLASGATTASLTNAPTTNGTTKISASSGDSSTHYFLVIDPDNSANREVILVTQSTDETLTTITRDVEGRHATDPNHQGGTTVRMAVLAEHFIDMNDRLDTGLTSLGNAVEITEIGNGLTWTGTQLDVNINSATDGTAITIDSSADYILVYDATDSTTKKLYVNQLPFATQAGASVGLVLALGG
jgi:hypothetical protein